MHNKLWLGFGVAVVAAAAVSFADASRYMYHQYLRSGYSQNCTNCRNTVVRPHSVSYVNPYARLNYRNVYRDHYKARCHLRDEYGCHYFNTQQLYRPAKDTLDYKLQRPAQNPRVENTFQSQRLVVRNGNYVDRGIAYRGEPRPKDLAVVDATYYTVNTQNFAKDNSGTYRQPGSSLAFRVLQSPSSYKCSQTNFWACVNRLTSNFKASQGAAGAVNLSQDFRWNDTQHLSFARFPTVTESFVAGGKTYYVFSALNPADGSVVRIEGVASQRDQAVAAQAMFQVFESFRFRQ